MVSAQTGRSGLGVGHFQIEDHHLGALLHHHAGGRKTQTVESGPASDDGHFVFEQHACLL